MDTGNVIIIICQPYLRPVQYAGRHLRCLVAVVINGEFAEHHNVGLLLLGELGEDLGHVEWLQGVHLVRGDLHVDSTVSTHGQSSPDGLLNE